MTWLSRSLSDTFEQPFGVLLSPSQAVIALSFCFPLSCWETLYSRVDALALSLQCNLTSRWHRFAVHSSVGSWSVCVRLVWVLLCVLTNGARRSEHHRLTTTTTTTTTASELKPETKRIAEEQASTICIRVESRNWMLSCFKIMMNNRKIIIL